MKQRFDLVPSLRGVAVVLCTLLAALTLTACGAIADLGTMSDTGESFMQALKANDNATSYKMLSTTLQSQIGGEQGWATFTTPRVPTTWNFSTKEINNGQGHLEGNASFANGQNLTVSLVLNKEATDWKVSGIDIH